MNVHTYSTLITIIELQLVVDSESKKIGRPVKGNLQYPKKVLDENIYVQRYTLALQSAIFQW